MPPSSDPNRFDAFYRSGQAPWDTGRPQPELLALEAAGELTGRILDAGCGTGEAALALAARGHQVWGFDLAAQAIQRAQAKALERGLDSVTWAVQDLLELGATGLRFDTVVDLAVLHTFDDEHWPRYAASLHAVLRPGGHYFGLAFSELEPVGWGGPRRVTQAQIRALFAQGWRVAWIRPAAYEVAFRPEPARAWLAKVERL